MEFVTVVNRTVRPLKAKFDGEAYIIPVGESTLTKVVVPFAKRQNPILGTMSPRNPNDVQFLIGVKGTKDPITQVDENTGQIELLDRSQIPGKAVHIKGSRLSRYEVSDGNASADSVAAVQGD